MQLGLAFWIVMLIWFVVGWINTNAPERLGGYGWWGSSILLLILLGLLGWHDFGPPLHQ